MTFDYLSFFSHAGGYHLSSKYSAALQKLSGCKVDYFYIKNKLKIFSFSVDFKEIVK
jgi:hypothetical protein